MPSMNHPRCDPNCDFCHGRPVANAARWDDDTAPAHVACPRCGGLLPASPMHRAAADLGRKAIEALRTQPPTEVGFLIEDIARSLDVHDGDAAIRRLLALTHPAHR
jgi:hypothetical protein